MDFIRSNIARLTAIIIIAGIYHLAQLPTLSVAERLELASRFHFVSMPLPTLLRSDRTIRDVSPALHRVAGWISSVGAAAALGDLDGDGLPNDACYVDTRSDQVIVAPVPGTGDRYKPFALNPAPLPYNAKTMAPMGCVFGDFNEDGLTDILVYYWGRTPVLFLRKKIPYSAAPKGVLSDQPDRLGASSGKDGCALSADMYEPVELMPHVERWYTNAVTTADFDGDGHVDILVANYFPDGAHILDAHSTAPEQMQHSMSHAFNGGGKHFLLWKGATAGAHPTAAFEEADAHLDPETAAGWTLAVAAADLDGRLLPDVYFANDFGPDRLLYNESTPGHLRFRVLQGRKTFTTPNSKVLGHDSFKGMGADFGDLLGNGRLDLFVSNIAENYALEESNFAFCNTGQTSLMKEGVAPFIDKSEPLGLSRASWSWDAKMADFDNSGSLDVIQAAGFVRGKANRWPELHELAMGNDELLSNPESWLRVQPGDDISGHQHCPFFVRASDGRFYDIASDIGFDDSHVARGIAVADVDGDGRLDFVTANQWDTSYYFRNESPGVGDYLELRLMVPLRPGLPSGTAVIPGHRPQDDARPAIGAEATIFMPDGRRFTAQVDGGNGHSGKRSPELHFGLGYVGAGAVIRCDLAWRDPGGRIHRETRSFHPGWYTVLLGWPKESGAEAA